MPRRSVAAHLTRVATRRARLHQAQIAFDTAVQEAVADGVTPTQLAKDAGVANRVWVYSALRRAARAADPEAVADGAS